VFSTVLAPNSVRQSGRSIPAAPAVGVRRGVIARMFSRLAPARVAY
jgi:hypothetical protein